MEKRIYSIDLLKFLFAVIIFFHHFQQCFEVVYPPPYINFFNGKVRFRYLVEFFFIISGFFLSMSFAKKIPKNFICFFVPKIIRLYPMVIICVLASVIISFVYRFCAGIWFDNCVPGLWSILNTMLLTFSGGAVKCNPFYNEPLWYICVLLICYCIFYFIHFFCKRHKIPYVYCFVIMSIIGIGIFNYNINFPFFNYSTGRGYASFFLGCIIHYVYANYPQMKKTFLKVAIGLSCCCIIAGCINFSLFYDDVMCQWGIFTFVLFPSIFIIFLEIDKLFVSKRWTVFGGISFELYIWHSPLFVLFSLAKETFKQIMPSPFVLMIFLLFVTICYSYLMYRFVERPIIKYLKSKMNQFL